MRCEKVHVCCASDIILVLVNVKCFVQLLFGVFPIRYARLPVFAVLLLLLLLLLSLEWCIS